jgi:hypothetical protein
VNSAIRCTVEQALGEVLVCAVLVLNDSEFGDQAEMARRGWSLRSVRWEGSVT